MVRILATIRSSSTEQNTLHCVGTNIENENQYEHSFIGVTHLLIQWYSRVLEFGLLKDIYLQVIGQ